VAKAPTSSGAALELLLAMRQHKIRQPELVMMHGGRLLNGSHRKLGNDVWTVLEQVGMAAADLGLDGWRDYCLQKLSHQFPGSVRVERLKGICQESDGKFAEAKKTYFGILTDKPEDTAAQKRLISHLKSRGKNSEAIEEINRYLDQFSTDVEAWHELGELYIECGSLQRAIFCFEELLVQNKRSLYNILTYAELMYSTGDFDTSRKYYCMACYLDGTCLRALWGLLAVNMALAAKDKGNDKMAQLQTFTIDRLKKTYAGKSEHSKAAISLITKGLPEV